MVHATGGKVKFVQFYFIINRIKLQVLYNWVNDKYYPQDLDQIQFYPHNFRNLDSLLPLDRVNKASEMTNIFLSYLCIK